MMAAPQIRLVRQTELFPETSAHHSQYAMKKRQREVAAANAASKKQGPPINDLTGQRFGNLVVSEVTQERHHGAVVFMCVCDCGRDIKVTGRHLQRSDNPVIHCGCLDNRPGSRGIRETRARANQQTALNALLATYRGTAARRGIAWSLPRAEFLRLVSSNCYYCGIEPHQVFTRSPHQFIYNGVDRVDSQKGYDVSNCVPCCGQCNVAKIDRDASDFLAWVDRVYQYQHREG